MATGPTLGGLFVYPVKSCAGIALTVATLDRFGLTGDRRWLVVDPQDRFLSQRSAPAMGQVRAVPHRGGLTLSRGAAQLAVPTPGPSAPLREVQVWDDQVAARDAGDAAAGWFSAALDRPCRLVFMADDARRPVDPVYAHDGESVSFADGFPLLLTTDASLAAINDDLDAPVSMRRFRPNLVVNGCAPFAEDDWRSVQIGDCVFSVAKPCARCTIPSLDPDTGIPHPTLNRVLARRRRFDGAILFGQNLLHRGGGTLRLGDPVRILE